MSINPGLLPVVQVTEVDVAADTGQFMPSIMMVYLDVSLENPVPENVTSVPPTTVPNLGVTAVNAAVNELTYSTGFRAVSISPIISFAVHV